MLKMITIFFLLISSFIYGMEDKIYLDSDEVKSTYDKFYIHQGHNIWLETNSLHRDQQGLFTFTSNLTSHLAKDNKVEYVKSWRCPYCHRYWPIGQPCQNKDCPSKY